jgi:O-antigen/teichoic acid export membrane protein
MGYDRSPSLAMKALLLLSKQIWTRDFLWAIGNQAILSLGAVAIITILSNVLSADTFGKTRFLVALFSILAFFSLPGIGPVVLQNIPLYSRTGLTRTFTTQLVWGIGATLGAWLCTAVFYIKGDFDLAQAFLISGILTPIANLYLMPGTALAGLKQYRRKALYDGCIILLTVLGTYYAALTTNTVTGTMAGYYGSQAIATIIAFLLLSSRIQNTAAQESLSTHDAIYGKQLTLFQFPLTFLPSLEKILVFILLGPAVLALYSIAFLPIEHIRHAYRTLLEFMVLPHMSKKQETHRHMQEWLLTAFFLSLGGTILVSLTSLYILPFLFPAYVEVGTLMLLSAIIPFTFPAYIYILKLISLRRIDRLYAYTLITVCIDIATFAVLTSAFGLQGALTAKVLNAILASVVAVILYRSHAREQITKRTHATEAEIHS